MKISIITVCFNSASTIEDTIKSVISQTHKNIEYIIVDGGSADETLSIIEKYRESISCIISEPDDGLYDAMNKGIRAATGDVIGILNSDDLFEDHSVLYNIAANICDSDVDACYGDLVYVLQNDLREVVRLWKSCPYEEKLWATGWMPAHPTFFAKAYVYREYGVFDTSNNLAADYEFLIRVIGKHKIRVKYLPDIIVRMRLGGATNKSIKNIVKQNCEIIRSAKRNGFNFSVVRFFLSKLRIKFHEYRNVAKYRRGEDV